MLEGLIREVAPAEVNPLPWLSWLQGGPSLFDLKKLKKVGSAHEKPGRTLERATHRVKAQERKIANMRAELEAEEARLVSIKAIEDGALHWHVADNLLTIIAPVFAMGPAWTILRSLSAYMSDEEADRLTRIMQGKEKARAIAQFREIKNNETEQMMDALDLFAGHVGFERALRSAIMQVVKEFEPKRESWLKSGGQKRSRKEYHETVRAESKEEREKILDGLKG